MIANWVHIMIVHIAVLGTPWLVYRVWVHRSVPLDARPWKGTFGGLIILAIITSVAYFTGPETADWTKQVLVPFPQDQVEDHALWGRVAFVIQGITGLIGIMGWASILQEEKPDRRIPIILLVLLIVNTCLMVYTAHLGGLIRRMDLM
jgi:amino acid transporter